MYCINKLHLLFYEGIKKIVIDHYNISSNKYFSFNLTYLITFLVVNFFKESNRKEGNRSYDFS